MDELTVRHYRAGDETRIIELFEHVFRRTMGRTESARHWKWEFLENPSGKLAILIAEDGPNLASHYAAMPVGIQVDGVPREGALSLDTATAEPYRGRGLFPRLARRLYDELCAQGCVMVFGFPNGRSAHGIFDKLHWTELAPFPFMAKPLGSGVARALSGPGRLRGLAAVLAAPVLGLLRRPARPVPESLRLEEVAEFGPDVDAFWAQACRGKRVSVVRDQRYLNWRYARNPEKLYRLWTLREENRLVGTLVTRVEERFRLRSGFIMDLVAEESRPDAARALVSLAETVTRAEGAEILTCLMYPGTGAHRALRDAGFMDVPPRMLPHEMHFGVLALTPDVDPAVLHAPSSWYIGWGDTDVL